MSAQHTPGPWRTTHTGPLGVGILPSTGELRTEGGPIITCWSACIGADEVEANARLIAAAPELLEALSEIERICGGASNNTGEHSIATKARAAIAKATGAA